MVRSLAAVLLLATSAAIPAGNAAFAQPPAAAHATLAAAPAADRIIAREQVWRCVGVECTAAASNSRPVVSCMALARKAGAVRTFAVAGVVLDDAALARCNSVAPTVSPAPQ